MGGRVDVHVRPLGKHLAEEPKDFELPLRLYRLATVRGTVDAGHQANFVVDTGGEVISISQATAAAFGRPHTGRKIALKVYGTSGWDDDAFLMPGVDLAFEQIQYRNFPVVVLNLDAPSALLGAVTGVAIASTYLTKLSNLPLIVIAVAVILVRLIVRRTRRAGLIALAALVLCAAVPIGSWVVWLKLHFGDVTGSTAKMAFLDWMRKPFVEWWQHPIFQPHGLWVF